MVKDYNGNLNKDSVVQSPKDVKLDGVVVKIEQGLLGSFIPEKHHNSFDNLDQETLFFHIECKFNDKIFKTTDRIAFYEEPGSGSKLGKYLTKYDELKVGQLIKVDFNGDGYGSIVVE